MIKSFKDKDTEKMYCFQPVLKWNNIFLVATRRLRILDRATKIADLAQLKGNRLHKLHEDREGQWSISINMQYRICFEWIDGDAYNVEICDYHK